MSRVGFCFPSSLVVRVSSVCAVSSYSCIRVQPVCLHDVDEEAHSDVIGQRWARGTHVEGVEVLSDQFLG